MKKSFIIILFTMLSIGAFSQSKWTSKPNSERAFVENKGQYYGRNWQSNNPIKFAFVIISLKKIPYFYPYKSLFLVEHSIKLNL